MNRIRLDSVSAVIDIERVPELQKRFPGRAPPQKKHRHTVQRKDIAVYFKFRFSTDRNRRRDLAENEKHTRSSLVPGRYFHHIPSRSQSRRSFLSRWRTGKIKHSRFFRIPNGPADFPVPAYGNFGGLGKIMGIIDFAVIIRIIEPVKFQITGMGGVRQRFLMKKNPSVRFVFDQHLKNMAAFLRKVVL